MHKSPDISGLFLCSQVDKNSAIKTSFFIKANLWHVDHIELYQNFHFGLRGQFAQGFGNKV